MKLLPKQSIQNPKGAVDVKDVFLCVTFFLIAGCSIWNGYLDPNNESSRADRLCHPYGECLQGTWVAVNETAQDAVVAKAQCQQEVNKEYGNGWWGKSVASGMEIGDCMETKGFRLQQR